MPSSTPQHGQHASRSPGTIPLSERQQMALLSRMTEEQKQHHSHVSVNKHGETPLHIAAKQGSESEVQELLSKGVDPNCPDAAGWTPLHEACIRGRYDIAKTLILAGADANAKGYQGFTPLHDAAANGHAELINLLLDFGADDTQRNHKGQAPVDVAPEPIKIIFKNRASDKPGSSEASSSSAGAPTSSVSTRNSVMRRLPPTNKESSGSSSNTPPLSPGPRVTLRLNQAHLKSSGQHRGGGNEESHHLGKKCKINLASTSGAYSTVEPSDGGSDAPSSSSSSKVKMENMEEILLKENTSAIETNPSQDETKDPLADTESVISPAGSAASTPHHEGKSGGGGSDKEGGERGEKRGATDSNMSSDEESKKKKRKEDNSGPGVRSKASSVSEGSPKLPPGGGHDSETEEGGGATHQESSLGGGGPKVPPLKIVLPSAAESDLSTGGSGRNGKSGTARHSALPYVVASDPAGDAAAGSAPASPSMVSGEQASSSETPATIKTEIKQEPMTEEQRTTQRILRSSHSRGSSSSSPAAPDASPSTVTVNTPPSSAVPSPGVPDVTIKSEPPSSSASSQSNPPSSQSNPPSAGDEKPTLPLSSEDPPAPAPTEPPSQTQHTIELHPRKRKLKHARADSTWNTSATSSSVTSSTTSATTATSGTNSVPATPSGDVKEVKEETVATGQPTSTDQPFTNCYQLYLNIRKQIDLRRKGLFPVKPITPTKFARYLMVTCDYVLANNNSSRHNVPKYEPPSILPPVLKDLFTQQEQDRYKLRMQHVVEKEKFALGVEQEILRVHCHAARELANQPLPYSACTILKDEEVYNLIGPDTDDKDSIEHKKDKRTDRYRYNGRLFIKWLRDIDDKWDKIKKRMIIRQTNEAESLHAVQKMDWEWKVRELSLEVPPPGEESYVPMISIVDDLQSTDELAS
uniref:Ankyrin repeat domain-containing protein 11 n=1 Tax=Cacopsylla melanoneura TaxID=428564 RepID=A0A8D8VD29_9HEMI